MVGKRLRLVKDLRHVNKYLVKAKFKYEDLRSLSQVLLEGSWFFNWDLTKEGINIVKQKQALLRPNGKTENVKQRIMPLKR